MCCIVECSVDSINFYFDLTSPCVREGKSIVLNSFFFQLLFFEGFSAIINKTNKKTIMKHNNLLVMDSKQFYGEVKSVGVSSVAHS